MPALPLAWCSAPHPHRASTGQAGQLCGRRGDDGRCTPLASCRVPAVSLEPRAYLLLSRLSDSPQTPTCTTGPGAGHGHTGGPVQSWCGRARSGESLSAGWVSPPSGDLFPRWEWAVGPGWASGPLHPTLCTRRVREGRTRFRGWNGSCPARGGPPWCQPLLGHWGRPEQPSRPRPATLRVLSLGSHRTGASPWPPGLTGPQAGTQPRTESLWEGPSWEASSTHLLHLGKLP